MQTSCVYLGNYRSLNDFDAFIINCHIGAEWYANDFNSIWSVSAILRIINQRPFPKITS